MSPSQSEFTVLRQTIASRGTVRMSLLPVTVIGWTAITVALLHLGSDNAILGLVPLSVLIGGFEAIHALNVGVERIGRYLQVYYEGQPDGPTWETTAMSLGPGLPGGGIDPLFTVVFAALAALNLTLAFPHLHTLTNYVVVLPVHAIFWIRIVRARGAAARQRAVDLETFRAVKSGQDQART
ncbi:MAG TPA: hypothetical protein VM846_13085 [Vicinamibacterales bacterium]|nr:hypothetical protein [Vicinamibacterales bacterium]